MTTTTTTTTTTTKTTTICCFESNDGRKRKTVDFKIIFRHRSGNIEEILEPAVPIQDSLNTLSFASPLCPSYKVKMACSREVFVSELENLSLGDTVYQLFLFCM